MPDPRHVAGWEPFALRSARVVAGWLVELGAWRQRHVDISAAFSGIMLLTIGVLLGIGGLAADTYMHRGVEQGDEEPFVIQPTGNGLATNVDLRDFAGGDMTSLADALESGGFSYVRQPVSWAEIETEAGNFSWELYDQIVNELARREIVMVAVIVDAPDWSRDSTMLDVADGPPVDPSSLGTFLQAFTDRYDTSVPFVQIWDQPNLAGRWGGTAATAAEFLPYLAAAYNGARAGNPEVRVITPELTIRSPEGEELADLSFLESLYGIGGASFFDIVGIQLDGGSTSPDDRRITASRHNLSRAVLARELMVAHGDAETPIWATSFGWQRTEETSESEQAEFVIRALERSWVEWPWMGLMFQWAFWAPEDSGSQPYALIHSDGSATELYRRLADSSFVERTMVGTTGFTPMDADSISYSGSWQDQHLEERTFRTTNQIGAEVTSTFRGTGVTAFMRIGPESGNVLIEVDGEIVPGGAGESGDEWDLTWTSTSDTPIELVSGLDYGEHELTIRLVEEGGMTLGGIIIERQQPFVWPVVLITVGSLIALFFGIRSIVILIGHRSGALPRPDDASTPALPSMPNWSPVRGA